MELVFATGNNNKVKEANLLLQHLKNIEVKSMNEIGIHDDIPETGNSLEENAELKSDYIFSKYKLECFSEDTGLEVKTLDGQPGIHSARYAGSQRSDEDNINKLLEALKNKDNRSARFRTVICLIIGSEKHFFEGITEGKITMERMGDGGFGYDPIFMPDGFDSSFAQMSSSEKTSISHRGKAMKKLVNFLESIR